MFGALFVLKIGDLIHERESGATIGSDVALWDMASVHL
jgi:hypothetical protein